MLDAVVSAVLGALCGSGLAAERSFPAAYADGISDYLICVSAKSAEAMSGGFASYLGVKKRGDGGESEVYGMRCDFDLALDIYARPEGGSAECTRLFDSAVSAVGGLGSGLKVKTLSCGQTSFDRDTGFLKCPCDLGGTAFLICETQGETGVFTDFVLKGEIA